MGKREVEFKDFDGGKTYDMHGESAEALERLIDRLYAEGGDVVQIITGTGHGVLKDHIRFLQKRYKFRILIVSQNEASFILDFT